MYTDDGLPTSADVYEAQLQGCVGTTHWQHQPHTSMASVGDQCLQLCLHWMQYWPRRTRQSHVEIHLMGVMQQHLKESGSGSCIISACML